MHGLHSCWGGCKASLRDVTFSNPTSLFAMFLWPRATLLCSGVHFEATSAPIVLAVDAPGATVKFDGCTFAHGCSIVCGSSVVTVHFNACKGSDKVQIQGTHKRVNVGKLSPVVDPSAALKEEDLKQEALLLPLLPTASSACCTCS